MRTLDSRIRDEVGYFADRSRLYCVGCKSWVMPVERDHGIGPYEYWGSLGVHHDWRTECPECDGEQFETCEPIDEPETEE